MDSISQQQPVNNTEEPRSNAHHFFSWNVKLSSWWQFIWIIWICCMHSSYFHQTSNLWNDINTLSVRLSEDHACVCFSSWEFKALLQARHICSMSKHLPGLHNGCLAIIKADIPELLSRELNIRFIFLSLCRYVYCTGIIMDLEICLITQMQLSWINSQMWINLTSISVVCTAQILIIVLWFFQLH